MLTEAEIKSLSVEYADRHPKDVLKLALDTIGSADLVLSFSGAEDVALIEMAWKLDKGIRVFTLDTGRLHAETYRFIERVRKHYGISIEVMTPDNERLQQFVQEKGLFSFYETDHHECCGIRKTEPLRRKLATVSGWVTGQRRDQSPGTRNNVDVIEADTTFSGSKGTLLKFNPLAHWSSQQVWEYIRMFDVPYNLLHEQGFISIGCEPCTRPVLPNQHEREGRWWWEEATAKECGLHAANLEKPEA